MSENTRENAKRARDALCVEFETRLRELAPYLGWGLTFMEGKWAISVHCYYLKMREATKARERAIRELLGTHFEFEGIQYPLDIQLGPVPRLQ